MRLLLMVCATGRDAWALLAAAAAGLAALLYAASSGLFDLQAFRLDPRSMRYPRQAKVEFWYERARRALWRWLSTSFPAEASLDHWYARAREAVWRWLSVTPPRQATLDYWYARAARTLWSSLARAGRGYAGAVQRAWAAAKRRWGAARARLREAFPGMARRMRRDMALGALAIAAVLVGLLLLNLL